MEANNNMMEGQCKCPHHKSKGWLIIIFGLAFLLGEFGVLDTHTVNIIWPIIVIVWGSTKLCRCCGGKNCQK